MESRERLESRERELLSQPEVLNEDDRMLTFSAPRQQGPGRTAGRSN